MRILIAAIVLSLCSCSPQRRVFELGVLEPLLARDRDAALRLGIIASAEAPEGAEVLSADESGRMSDFKKLRFATARAIVAGRDVVYFKLPPPPSGGALVDLPEEWQALARVAREIRALRRVLEFGDDKPPFLAVPGLEERSWRLAGRRYTLLINASMGPVSLGAVDLSPWRAMFETRADPREIAAHCGESVCLAPGRALWLEGRP